MKKILLIDDRTERQINFSKQTGFDFNSYSSVMDNITANAYEEFIFRHSDGIKNLDYEVIITHRSAFGEMKFNMLDTLKNISKNQNKKLVFFSGGISSSFYLKEPFEFLLINSKTMYSGNLKLFLDDCIENEPNLLILGYGNNWRLNLLLNVMEKVNYYIGKNSTEKEVPYNEFESESHIELLEKIVHYEPPTLRNGWIEMSTLKKLGDSITKKIKDQVVIYA